jgi:hypothetical protein
MKRSSMGMLTAVALGCVPGHVSSQDPLEAVPAEGAPFGKEWGLAFTPYVFFASQSTDVGSFALRQSFNDLATLTDFGFQGRLTARYRRLLFAVDGTFARLTPDLAIGRTTVDGEILSRILDLKLYWPVFDSRRPDRTGGVGVWVGLGARYWSDDVSLAITREPVLPGGDPSVEVVETVQSWWDPALALALHFPVTPSVGFSIRATGGGFGVGNASSFMWDGEFTALFRVSRRLLVSAGYRQFRYKRVDGEGDEALSTHVSVIGPLVGLSIGIF